MGCVEWWSSSKQTLESLPDAVLSPCLFGFYLLLPLKWIPRRHRDATIFPETSLIFPYIPSDSLILCELPCTPSIIASSLHKCTMVETTVHYPLNFFGDLNIPSGILSQITSLFVAIVLYLWIPHTRRINDWFDN